MSSILSRLNASFIPMLLVAMAVLFYAASGQAANRQIVKLAVAKYNISPGEIISASMIDTRAFQSRALRHLDVVSDPRDLVGLEVRRRLRAGNPIPAGSVMRPRLVKRGTITRIVFQTGPMTIIAHVEPLDSGSVGDIVRARNIDSGVVVSGIVDAEGTIRVME